MKDEAMEIVFQTNIFTQEKQTTHVHLFKFHNNTFNLKLYTICAGQNYFRYL